MSWKNIDFFEMEPPGFSEELHAVIVPFFDQGSEKLAEWEQERKDLLNKMLGEAMDDEGEVQFAYNLADLGEWRNVQRGQVLGAAGLHHLYATLKAGLKQLARYFDQSHPRTPESYKGKSELDRLKEEYVQRFGIDLEKSTLFASVRELALARNAGIHPHAETFEEYAKKVVSPRFYKNGMFHVERQAFLEILGEIERFFEWVTKEMLPIRKASGSAKKKPEDAANMDDRSTNALNS